jgi:hypothetical protein
MFQTVENLHRTVLEVQLKSILDKDEQRRFFAHYIKDNVDAKRQVKYESKSSVSRIMQYEMR